MARLALVALVVFLAVAPVLPQQKTPPAAGVISGVVVNGATGEPVPDAVVILAASPARSIATQTRQLTDERGRFVFVQLPGDVSYTLGAAKFGYLDGGYGRDTMPADPLREIPLKPNEWVSTNKIPIFKPGALSGAVRDEAGESVVGVVVRALMRVRIQGRDEFIAGPVTRTDDRGRYRLHGLQPGKYIVQIPSVQAALPATANLTRETLLNPIRPIPALANEVLDLLDVDQAQRLAIGRYAVPPPPANGKQWAYPPVFYPSATSLADASTIELKFGDDRQDLDLTITPVQSVRVSGTVDGPPQSLQSLTLRLMPLGLENQAFGAEVATALVGSDGSFTFINVPAGRYIIDAPNRISEMSTVPASIGIQKALPGPPTTPVTGAMMTSIELIAGVRLTHYNFRNVNAPFTGRAAVNVGNADVTGVVVRMVGFSIVSGRLAMDPGANVSPDTPAVRVSLELDPAGGETALTGGGRTIRSDRAVPGDFSMANIVPGRYWIRVQREGQQANPWMVKSVSWNGRDYTNTPIEVSGGDALDGIVVTVTNAPANLRGTVRDQNDLKADATMVIAFPVDPSQWKDTGLDPARMKAVPVSNAHAFAFTNLPGGDYYVAAISRSFTDRWREPEFLTRVAVAASRVTLTWGGKSTIDLTAVVVR